MMMRRSGGASFKRPVHVRFVCDGLVDFLIRQLEVVAKQRAAFRAFREVSHGFRGDATVTYDWLPG
jgi:hypothetical protein